MTLSSSTRHVRSIAPDAVNRAENDFYRTPRVAVTALLDREEFTGRIWEPACGDGAISTVMLERGLQVRSTDLVERGYGTAGVDFLRPREVTYPTCNCVITNPPFTLAQRFAERALAVADTKVALLARLLWLESEKRFRFFTANPPRRIWVFSQRINVARMANPKWIDGRGGMIAFAWYVWEVGYTGPTELCWVKPAWP